MRVKFPLTPVGVLPTGSDNRHWSASHFPSANPTFFLMVGYDDLQSCSRSVAISLFLDFFATEEWRGGSGASGKRAYSASGYPFRGLDSASWNRVIWLGGFRGLGKSLSGSGSTITSLRGWGSASPLPRFNKKSYTRAQ
ncbi:hypothetical protein PIB30_060269 [Stylosanthes scabra]|uniref:Uncharacterized protein n=1 Tax=Stylosanthes scabra TaxID=79078 RepID=A0ABU6SMA9_9FABA|nr:hypothetical protein [Stylosanthes scabra]